MLTHPTIDKLEAMRCKGMAAALQEQLQTPGIEELSFEERLGLLIDREMTLRHDRRMQTRLRKAKLRQAALVEDIDFRHPRGLDKAVMVSLSTCQWIRDHQNLVITGPTGVGKTYLACALSQKACRDGYSARYLRLPRLFQDLALAKGDGSYAKALQELAKVNVLLLDDFGLASLAAEQRHDLLEILEDRHGVHSTLITSQLPVKHWHETIGDDTLADAILDRLIHNAHRINLKGESMRKAKSSLTKNQTTE